MKKRRIMILILLLIIGFASVTTTLVLNGKVGIGVELDDFNVIFIEALLDGKEDIRTSISEDKKTITFSTDKLINVGDNSRLDYKVKNTSTQYNADVEINCTNETSEYVNVTSSFDGNSIPLVNPVNIKAQEVKSGYINAELIKAYAGEDTSVEIKCTINVTATSRETYAYSLMFNSNGGSSIDDKSVVLNEEYGELEEPVREGYTFLGWYDEEDNKADSSTIFDSKGNRNLKAKWEVNEYPVAIKTNEHGTSESSSINVEYEGSTNIKITPDQNYYISSIECTEGYTVENYNEKIPQYGEQSITIRNNKIEKEGTCTFSFSQGIFEYGYTGGEQTFSAPLNGEYKIELWGAQGGTGYSTYLSVDTSVGGQGGYSSGHTSFQSEDKIFITVGGQGSNSTRDKTKLGIVQGGYNGGGTGRSWNNNNSYVHNGAGGGGATHVAVYSRGLLKNYINYKNELLIIAAGGGGGGGHNGGDYGGYAGGLNGGSAAVRSFDLNTGGTQTSGGTSGVGQNGKGNDGGFGYGGNSATSGGGGGGGAGYFGGAGGYWNGGGGGSSYISGYSNSSIANDHYNFTDTAMLSGNESIPTHDGKSTMTGNSGNGYAKITLVSID